jgi:hypothetical protein
MHDIVLCRVQYVTHGKEKGLTAVRGETTSHSLYRAPLRTHGNGSILCRALGSAAHGKDCFRRQVDQGLCRASHGGGRTTKNGPCARWTRPFAMRRAAGRTTKDGPGAWWTRPVAVRLVEGCTAKNGQFVACCGCQAHDKLT